jgi:hypothetical protein
MLAASLFLGLALHAGSENFVADSTDQVTLKSGETLSVRPLAHPLGKAPVSLLPAAGGKPRLTPPSEIVRIEYFETRYLNKCAVLPNAAADLAALERTHTHLLRLHYAWRDCPPLQNSPWQALEAALEDRGDAIRTALLHALMDNAATEADWRRADAQLVDWMARSRPESPLRSQARKYWVQRGLEQCRRGDYAGARSTLDRFEREFPNHMDADSLRGKLEEQALLLVAAAASESPIRARRTLQESRVLWPGVKGWANAWQRVEPASRVLRIASPRVPSAFSPETAASPEDHVALDLLHACMLDLLDELPPASTELTLKLRRDNAWSDGRIVTADDLRFSVRAHSKTLVGKGLGEMLEEPRSDSDPFRVTLPLRRGLFAPWHALRIHVVAREGQAICGPYSIVAANADGAVFHPNPNYRGPARTFDMVRWTRWTGVSDSPPDIVWDAPPSDREALLKAGYRDFRVLSPPRVWLIALNVQRPGLANVDLRRALAHAVPREKLLDRHFRAGQKLHASANGPFAPGSWGQAPGTRVPAHLDQPAFAAGFAKKAAADIKNVQLLLLAPTLDAAWRDALGEMCKNMEDALKEAGIHARIAPMEKDAAEFRRALDGGDYDMALTWVDRAEYVLPLVPLTGGDPRLQQLVAQLLRHRDATIVRGQLHDFHAALVERMPVIPLWRLDIPVAVHSGASFPALDALHPFAK